MHFLKNIFKIFLFKIILKKSIYLDQYVLNKKKDFQLGLLIRFVNILFFRLFFLFGFITSLLFFFSFDVTGFCYSKIIDMLILFGQYFIEFKNQVFIYSILGGDSILFHWLTSSWIYYCVIIFCKTFFTVLVLYLYYLFFKFFFFFYKWLEVQKEELFIVSIRLVDLDLIEKKEKLKELNEQKFKK